MKRCLLLLLSLFSLQVFAQGCSDAGVCTIGNSATLIEDSSRATQNKLSLNLPFGKGDEGVFVFTPSLQFEKILNKHLSFQTKLTANYASGNLGNAFGAGDFFLSAQYLINPHKKAKHSLLLGSKLPLNQSNLKSANKVLPMQYQSSLGTIDLIVGYSIQYKRLLLDFALQQPLSGRNRNTFLPEYWNSEAAFKYAPSNDFNRKGDVLLSTAYQLISSKKYFLQGTVLGIYHLKEDTYVDANKSISPIKIMGSEGLTVNLAAKFLFLFNTNFTIGATVAAPIVVRKIRPDGLTRSFVLSPVLNIHF